MKRRLPFPSRPLGPLLLTLALAGRAVAQDPVDRTLELASGETLEYIERVPLGQPAGTRLPLFVCLAPGTGDESMVHAARMHLGDLAWKAGFLTVYPVSRSGGFGGDAADEVLELVERVLDEHPVDRDRIVLAGLSNGGRAVFDVAVREPRTFAALVAAPGTAAAELDLSELSGTPVWMRVGGTDSEDWRAQASHTAERLERAGARVDFAVTEGQGHVLILGSQGLFEWLEEVLAPGPRLLQFPAPDGLAIEAELHGSEDRSRPVVVLCHQAGSSRGEYAAVAPRLAQAGYTCLAIDQRSGKAMNGVTNQTAVRAEAARRADPARGGRPIGYLDARVDIAAALDWVRHAGFDGSLALWGSSYSASLALDLGATRDDLDAILCFSPGEYFGEELDVTAAAARVECPVLVVAPEKERAQVRPIVDALRSGSLVAGEGIVHGSKTLYTGTQSDRVWTEVLEFLRENLASPSED